MYQIRAICRIRDRVTFTVNDSIDRGHPLGAIKRIEVHEDGRIMIVLKGSNSPERSYNLDGL